MIVRRLLAISLLGLVLLACPPTPTSLPAPTGTPAPATAAVVEPSISATVTPVISRATPTSTPVLPSPTPTPKPAPTIFQKVLAPFVELAKLRRDQNEEYQRCADKELNQGRLNLLLLGYGETFEPRPEKPDPAPIIIGSLRYLSLDLASNTVAEISLTHDIRCPECEIALAAKQKIKRQEAGLFRLDQAYLSPAVGSFSLLGKTLCNATGLWPDFQIAFHDTFLRDLVDGPLEGVFS